MFTDPTLGDAILERLVHNAYQLRAEGRIDAQARNEIEDGRGFRLTMQTCVAALRLPVRMSVERVSGCWWAECPDGVESAARDSKIIIEIWHDR